MSLRRQLERNGSWLFRHRSYLPLLMIPVFLACLPSFKYLGASHKLNEVWQVFCLMISLSGLAVRIITVGRAPLGTSGRNTREQVAHTLTTTGIYSVVRHPLYLGNYLVLLMFYYGYVAFRPMRDVPMDAIPITVIGKMWVWSFEYEGGKLSPVLVVPINKPVKLNLHSDDVIHSLYIPAFRIKEDVVPGKKNYMWFVAQQLGEYDVLCTVYCGLRHSYMETKTKVVSEAEYAAFLKALPEKTNEPEGLAILKKNACTGCHSIDGSKIVSASFKGLYGREEKVVTGGKERSVTVDDAYIKSSVYDPDKDVVAGYQKGIMKPYKGIVTEDEMIKIIDYFKSIK